ncbi:hypothetical protein [Limosilactobacillus vaginalis]|uniref:hypothetical protein n=1 Tax=Limosilactobacillus vaginalis TaxID=1633 RepID=UPI00242C39F3|nr:hypothetical protein [Limosilactobacillus vaginalis]
MIILASTNSSAIYSGLIAAIVSGIVSLIGYVITAVIQSKNGDKAINTQREIAMMEKDEKLFYESQLRWNDEVRKLFASFIKDCTVLSRTIKEVDQKKNENVPVKEAQKSINEMEQKVHDAVKRVDQLQETASLIRLYLFDEDNAAAKMVLDSMLDIIQKYGKMEAVSGAELNNFIDVARQYLYEQLKELQIKTM